MVFPENVAYPLGGPDDKKYALIQMHYKNPNQDKGSLFLQNKQLD